MDEPTLSPPPVQRPARPSGRPRKKLVLGGVILGTGVSVFGKPG
jgi:hypothetical protein